MNTRAHSEKTMSNDIRTLDMDSEPLYSRVGARSPVIDPEDVRFDRQRAVGEGARDRVKRAAQAPGHGVRLRTDVRVHGDDLASPVPGPIDVPSLTRDDGPGTIHYAVRDFSLGMILTARSSKGLCAVLLGDDRGALRRDLGCRFPGVHLLEADGDLEDLSARVIEVVESRSRGLEASFDLRGTDFQRRVWDALQRIPAGSTITYGELAKVAGLPGGARAVARACAANPLAVIVPCHRVIKSGGGLSGYRWGVWRKRALLEREVGG